MSNQTSMSRMQKLLLKAHIMFASVFVAILLAFFICLIIQQLHIMVIVMCALMGLVHGLKSIKAIESGVGLADYRQSIKKIDI